MFQKLYIGDSRKILPNIDEKVNLVVCSPPYNVGKDYEKHDDTISYRKHIELLEEVFKKCYGVMKDHSYICINIGRNTGVNQVAHVAIVLEELDFNYQAKLHWKKPEGAANQTFTEGQYPYPRYYEPKLVTEDILVYSKGKINEHRGERREEDKLNEEHLKKFNTNIWEMNPAGQVVKDAEHPAPFPKTLPENCIKFYTRKGDTVLDPFLGSGSSLLASRELGRNGIGIELNENYIPAIKKRVGWNQQSLNQNYNYDIIFQEEL